MAQFYLIPSWFFGLGIVLELLFGLITLAVAFYSFKVYRYCLQRNCKLFGWSFLALALSYFLWAAMTAYAFFKLKTAESVVPLADFSSIISLGVYSHAFFFIIGLATMTYMTFNIKSQRVYTLFISILLISLIFSAQKIIAFYFLSSLLLFYIVLFYFLEYEKGKKNQLMTIAFLFLLIGSIDFTFSAVHHVPYVVGHILFFVGYLFILINFILMLKPLSKGRGRSVGYAKKKK